MTSRNSIYLKGGTVILPEGPTRCDIVVRDGKIAGLPRSWANTDELPEIDASGLTVLPGFIDIHTHGAAGHDVNAADEEGLRAIGRFFASQGVTGWLCSVLTDTPEQTLSCMNRARNVIETETRDGAALLGIHLEGPCLASEYKGAMPEHLLMHEAHTDLFSTYQKAAGGHVLYTTLAPEVPGVERIIPELNSLGITCAIGHSGANYDQAVACIEAGAQAATHVGNAMRLFHQHDPAIFGAVLERDVYVEAICDGRHLHPGSVRLYLAAKGWDRVIAVSDSIMATGLPDGPYKLGVNDIVVVDGDAKLADSGVRAGSTLTLSQALRNIISFTGCDVASAVRLMSANPARLLGLSDRGSIARGYRADLTLVDDDLTVKRTIVEGHSVYCA